MSEKSEPVSIEQGVKIIKDAARKLPQTAGVYRMLGARDEVLYVGKAKALQKRVLSYVNFNKLPVRMQRMVSQTRRMEFVHTHTEAEALLLESNLIKKYKPRYNVLLRDDKSFPYILIPEDHDFPLVCKHRGARKIKGDYFGPFASAGAVNRTIAILQRVFMLRNCTDSYFAQRKRPCLQYHIKRCTAPCVDLVSKEEYGEQVSEARAFLEGKSRQVQERMLARMQSASGEMDYETAAHYRDRLQALNSIQASQDINIQGLRNADAMALVNKQGRTCIQVFFFRAGRNYGNRAYFPRHDKDEELDRVFAAFIAQFYQHKPIPMEIILNFPLEEKPLLEEALTFKIGHNVKITNPSRGPRRRVVDFVRKNAEAALERHIIERSGEAAVLQKLAEMFDMEDPPERIEVYDNSHISGTNMIGAMIVAGPEGYRKNAYRKFNIKRSAASDDYGMMREVLSRRFARALKENPNMAGGDWPDLVIIDGGQGQFNAAREVLEECGIFEQVKLLAIAKGADRNAGREKFFVEGKAPFRLPVNDPVLHYLQRLRDEAHRFAIGTHRARRQKQISSSPLDEIAGIGARRKKALLHHFGSAKAVAGAGVDDLEKVEGISRAMAKKIYDYFH